VLLPGFYIAVQYVSTFKVKLGCGDVHVEGVCTSFRTRGRGGDGGAALNCRGMQGDQARIGPSRGV
jgi:hypothetical protein